MCNTKRFFATGAFVLFVLTTLMMFGVEMVNAAWEPPSNISREEIVKASKAVLAMPDIKAKKKEHIFRIRVLGMDWDIGVMVYEPEDASKIPLGPDGKKAGIFLLHGGSGDYRSKEKLALLLVRKYGYRVTNMTYTGRLYLEDPSRNWPGDTIHPDGTVRTPIWKKGELITPDQYEIVEKKEDLAMRKRYGTQIQAKAKEGTTFYYRMAAWPVAFEEAMLYICRNYLPEDEYSIYAHGASTGGPFVAYLTQRVPNIVGIIGIENTPFGYIYAKMMWEKERVKWDVPFTNLTIRTWRDKARYAGPQALAKEGPKALRRLAMLMEEVFESWKKGTHSPNIKAEYSLHYANTKRLAEGARVTAKRLNMSPQETEALVKRYQGYTRELSGPGVKPVPPLLLGLAKDSRDHTLDAYQKWVLPMFAAMKPPPKVRVIQFGAGVHSYMKREKDLPMGIGPAVLKLWYDAIMGGYYLK